MSPESLVQIGLIAFVLLAPTVMVAMLVSGIARRADGEPEPVTTEAVAPAAARTG